MFRLFVLGAGFSRHAGLPLGAELFAAVVAEARRRGFFGDESAFQADVERYGLYLERTTGRKVTVDTLDLEEFMSFLDAEHALRFAGSDTWMNEGNKTQLLVRYLIAWVLYWKQVAMSRESRDLYDQFASHLEPADRIITFNYDTIVEDALDRVGKPYRLVPARYKEVTQSSASYPDEPDHDIVIYKMHGSIDWFDRRPFQTERAYRRRVVHLPDAPRNPVFNNRRIKKERLVRGPYWNTSALRHLYRVRNLGAFFDQAIPAIDAPLIVSPSFNKILYLTPLAEFWEGFDTAGSLNGTVIIIGYSLPRYDEYVRMALYRTIRNFQHYDTGKLVPKTNMRLVDYRASQESQLDYRNTYRFVEWDRAEVFFDGFGPATVPWIFAG